jgi:deazaflavin-dependent oxidoreductase (nitroreductase family)
MTKQYRVTWATRLINRPFDWLARRGLGADYRYVLTVRGRRSGKPYSTPVDAIEHGGRRWLVAPYGITNWVRNARAAGEVELRRGDRTERMRVREAFSADAAPILRRYLELVPVTRPYFEVGPDASDEALAAEAERHPVFQLESAPLDRSADEELTDDLVPDPSQPGRRYCDSRAMLLVWGTSRSWQRGKGPGRRRRRRPHPRAMRGA